MSAFGLSPLGTGLGPFGGPGLITVLGVLPLSVTSFVVVFDVAPKALDSEALDSGTNAGNYEMTSTDPTIYPPLAAVPTVPPGAVVPTRQPFPGIATADRADPRQVIIETDSRMDPHVQQVVHISSQIAGRNGETFAGPQDWGFRSPGLEPGRRSAAAQARDRYRDLAWDITGSTGDAYRYDANRDIGINDGRTSLRSRIYRRVFTSPGGFTWLPAYGVGVRIKKLARTSERHQLADTVASQAQLEPEVIEATAEVTFTDTSAGGVVDIALYVRLVDSTTQRITYSLPTSST